MLEPIDCLANTRLYVESFLKIKTKAGEIVPLKFNHPQARLYEAIKAQAKAGKPIRVIVLKARQTGFSTVSEAIIYKKTATNFNTNALITAHVEESTKALFEMAKRFYELSPPQIRPQTRRSNAYELVFDTSAEEKAKGKKGLDSMLQCKTAGSGSGVGRAHTYRCVHASEYAHWQGDAKATLSGILASVPALPGTIVIIESTANGFNDFRTKWRAAEQGKSDYCPVFVPWFELEEYRMEYDGFELDEEELRLKECYKLDNGQLAWRRWCIKNNCGGDVEMFHQEYPSNPHEAFIATGNCYFGADGKANIIKRIERLEAADFTPERGSFDYDYDGLRITNPRWVPDKDGSITLYKRPEYGVPYVLGGDTAGEGSDNFTGHVLNNTTAEQVAVFCNQLGEELYARQMYCLGMYYNTAMIGIEVNFSTYPVKELERLQYPHQFIREKKDVIGVEREKKFGFKTDVATRPNALATLAAVIRECPETINDIKTLEECLTFIKNEHGRAEAEEGEHDDNVMGLAIAHAIRPQQSYITKIRPEAEPKQEFYQKGGKWIVDYGN